MTQPPLPKLRGIDARPIIQEGRHYFLLLDPLELSPQRLLIPREFAPVLGFLDGTRDSQAIIASMAVRLGIRLPPGPLDQLLEALDNTYLLENERYLKARSLAVDEFRQAAFRQPASAGESYPHEVEELRSYLGSFLENIPDESFSDSNQVRGLVSPHIDYGRGGPVYARVWKRAAEAVKAADLVIIFGTDHYSEPDQLLTLTRQNYATPFGVLPTSCDVVDAISQVRGLESAFDGELRHRSEHSVELAAVWLHYIRDEEPCDIVPILCGSIYSSANDKEEPAQDIRIKGLLDAITRATVGRRVVVIAAGDLAHVGPAFEGQPLDFARRAKLKAADEALIERMCAGDHEGVYDLIRQVENKNNVCGLAPIYLTMRLLQGPQGEKVAYDLCPADQNGTSAVSVCGVIFW